MLIKRRKVLKAGSAAIGGALILGTPWGGRRLQAADSYESLEINDERIKKLSKIAVDSAMSKGASYADVRLTYTKQYSIRAGDRYPGRNEAIGIGVRSLCDGYWGFASSPVWSESEAARLGAAASANAKANFFSRSEPFELGLLGSDQGGSWIMPVKYDPFVISIDEVTDHITGLVTFISSLEKVNSSSIKVEAFFQSQDKYFYSSKNQAIFQRLYNSSGVVAFDVSEINVGSAFVSLDNLSPAGVGFELIKDPSLRDYIRENHAEALREMTLPVLPVDVGRYEVLMNRRMVAPLISESIGAATELDRVFGFEANAGGTSYITSPEEMIGSLQLTGANVSIIADRTSEGSVGRVAWDDEGMKPNRVTIVKNGRLNSLQGSNDGFSLLKDFYNGSDQKFTPTGGMTSETGIESPLLYSSDLIVETDDSAGKIDDLRSSIKTGLEMKNGGIMMDFQKSTGYGIGGSVFKIENGKRVARVINSGVLFRTQNLWKNVTAFGHQSEVMRFGCELSKGEPSQTSYHSVYSPNMIIKDMDIIDSTRKA